MCVYMCVYVRVYVCVYVNSLSTLGVQCNCEGLALNSAEIHCLAPRPSSHHNAVLVFITHCDLSIIDASDPRQSASTANPFPNCVAAVTRLRTKGVIFGCSYIIEANTRIEREN